MPPPRGSRCFVVGARDGRASGGRRLVAELRAAGVAAGAPYEERPLKAQLKQADRAGAAFAAIVGERELADGTVTLRRLADGARSRSRRRVAVARRARRLGGRR